MTKLELIEALAEFADDAEVVTKEVGGVIEIDYVSRTQSGKAALNIGGWTKA